MFLIRALIFVLSAAVGLIAADLLLPGFRIDWADWWGFVLAVLIFAVLQSVLSPWIATVAKRNAPALLGGIGIISTLVALVIVVLIPREVQRRLTRPSGVVRLPHPQRRSTNIRFC